MPPRHQPNTPEAPLRPTTYTLPDLPWAVLLPAILRDARRGDVIEVYTDAMRAHVEQVMQAGGRADLVVRQVEPPPPKPMR